MMYQAEFQKVFCSTFAHMILQNYASEVLQVLIPTQIPQLQVKARCYFKGGNYLTFMKPAHRDLAIERMQILLKNAISNARSNPDLAQRQASLAKRLSTKYRIRMPFELRMNFCKKCKMFIAPGITSRIRIGRSTVKSIRITCGFCNHTYHKIIKKD